ncbi:MAG TPA: SDR family oxidoreductase [Syntrophobacteria bacterium]|nr:SDR family oxidoreductase [Syntrophobacteria bacterium]
MTSDQKTVFISGANRGIGLGMALLMARKGYTVFAGYRDRERSARLLDAAGEESRIMPVKVDVTREDDLKGLVDTIASRAGHLDILVNSAGINPGKDAGLDSFSLSDLTEGFLVNVGGPFLATKYLLRLLKEGREKKVVNISSMMGSIQLSTGDMAPYRLSKAALNMLTKNQAIAYQRYGITVVCLHPGWVRTDMGGPEAPVTVEEAVPRLLGIIEEVSPSRSGEFISFDGQVIPY